jgi:hypothetical protein
MAVYVLGSADRLAQNLSSGERLWPLTGVLCVASVAAAAPFGAVAPLGAWWSVPALFTGSLLICLPCLYCFLQFLGFRITLARNLSLSLTLTATAGLFALGFFPIMWFIDRTTRAGDDSAVAPAGLMRFLLGVSLFTGVVQMARCMATRDERRDGVRDGGGMTATILLWLSLLVFVVWRMAGVLGLRG